MQHKIRSQHHLLGIVIVTFFILSACGAQNDDNDDSAPDSETDETNQTVWECRAEPDAGEIDFLPQIGCEADFDLIAALPSNSSLPGAKTVKTIIDRADDNTIYFQNTQKYSIHYEFASEHLSGGEVGGIIVDQDAFNDNYNAAQRRFVLGAVTYYDDPAKWVYEISSYDNADAAMVTDAVQTIAQSAFFGDRLYFHPTGEGPEEVAKSLPETVKVVTTEELYEDITYQALNLARTCGRLVFMQATDLETSYVGFRDIVVLDTVPNDISVVQGIITAEFQTPLSHVNVLSQNRGTPNMGLRDAFENEELRALEGEWVILDVGAFDYTIEKTTKEYADECWNAPEPIGVPDLDLSVTDLRNIEELIDIESDVPVKDQISANIPAFGGKASHYGGLAHIPEANAPEAFAIPIFYYDQFMQENGFDKRVAAFLEDDAFDADPEVRDTVLAQLRDDMLAAPINEDLFSELIEKLNTDFPGTRMRFRSSTNAEDLGDFTGAGLYTSKSGDPNDPDRPVEEALKTVWSSIWFFRAFEERSYRGIAHDNVGMALLVHRSFPDEEANGVALTANPFDTSGTEPGFYINVQRGDNSVVEPAEGMTTDQFIYYFDMAGQPIEFIEHSNLVASGYSVLTNSQVHDLGVALRAIHTFFYPAYGPALGSNDWYAMDVEFKFDGEEGEEPPLWVKQARPHPGR